MRLSAWTATPTSVARRASACARSPSPITRFHLAIVASARARLAYPDAFCQAVRPCSTMCRRWRSRCGYRQVKLEGDGEAPKLARAANLCGSLGARDLGPDRERLRADGSVVSGRKMIAVQVEEVVDLVVGGEEPLRLAG